MVRIYFGTFYDMSMYTIWLWTTVKLTFVNADDFYSSSPNTPSTAVITECVETFFFFLRPQHRCGQVFSDLPVPQNNTESPSWILTCYLTQETCHSLPRTPNKTTFWLLPFDSRGNFATSFMREEKVPQSISMMAEASCCELILPPWN